VLAEALRNAQKHADPTSVRVRVCQVEGAFVLDVRNDGADAGSRGGTGMGLRLAAVEALQRGALVEFGRDGAEWKVRLVVPLVEDDSPDEP
jgi:two-component sensor histidine kinase